MIVAVSRITVTSGNADAVAAAYADRSGLVDEAHGFLGLEVLRHQDRPDEFWVVMRWSDRDAFDAYRGGARFKDVHASVGRRAGRTTVDADSYAVDVLDVVAR